MIHIIVLSQTKTQENVNILLIQVIEWRSIFPTLPSTPPPPALHKINIFYVTYPGIVEQKLPLK